MSKDYCLMLLKSFFPEDDEEEDEDNNEDDNDEINTEYFMERAGVRYLCTSC